MTEEPHKNKNNYLWIGIAVVVVIVLAIVFISNKNVSNEITCNSPYIKVGTSCCLDQNSNGICDNDEEQEEKIYATAQDLDVELEHFRVLKYDWDESETCSNGYNAFDMWIKISLDIADKCGGKKICQSYTCNSELVVGDRTDLWKNAVWYLSESGGYYTEGWTAMSQKLKQQQQVRVCCSPNDKQGQELCKTVSLGPYC